MFMLFCRRYAKNLSSDKINLSTFKGEGELRNLELDQEVMTELLSLPSWMKLTQATCNHVLIRIPWTKLKSVPIHLVSKARSAWREPFYSNQWIESSELINIQGFYKAWKLNGIRKLFANIGLRIFPISLDGILKINNGEVARRGSWLGGNLIFCWPYCQALLSIYTPVIKMSSWPNFSVVLKILGLHDYRLYFQLSKATFDHESLTYKYAHLSLFCHSLSAHHPQLVMFFQKCKGGIRREILNKNSENPDMRCWELEPLWKSFSSYATYFKTGI